MATVSTAAAQELQQFMLPLFGGEMFSASNTPEAFTLRQPKQKITNIDLTLPLFNLEGEVAILFDNEEAGTSIQVGVLSYMDEMQEEKLSPWSGDGIARLHSVLLEESLKALAARSNARQKEEVLQWIFRPDALDMDRNTGEFVYADETPFTFQLCCKLEGMNPEVIRDFLRRRISSLA
mgnify:CR=1 FL=1